MSESTIMVKAHIKWHYYTQQWQDQNRLLYIHILIFCGCVPWLSCTSQSDAVWIVSLGGHAVLTLHTTEAKKKFKDIKCMLNSLSDT